jgi:hydrogenase/urease accessory protein HupE
LNGSRDWAIGIPLFFAQAFSNCGTDTEQVARNSSSRQQAFDLSCAALGALLAADCLLPVAFVASLAVLLGLIHGILNGSELAGTPASGQMAAAGVAVALFVAVSLLAGEAASVRTLWARVAVRVAGSWIVGFGIGGRVYIQYTDWQHLSSVKGFFE